MNWNDLKFFLEVARARSLSAAARSLGVSISTVSRRIEVLEADLDITLFRRHRDGYELSQAGRDLLGPAEAAEAQLRLLVRSAQQSDGGLTGTVRIDVPELIGQHIVLPGLESLLQDHPGIQLDLHSSVRSVNLAGQESDIVLRLVRPDRGNYKIRLIGQIGFGIYGSRSYLARHGAVASADNLRQHRIISWSEELRYLTMASWLNDLCPDLSPAMYLDSFSAQIAAVRHGYGIAVLPHFAAAPEGLVEMLEAGPKLQVDLWLLTHSQSATVPRVRAVVNFLSSLLSRFDGPAQEGGHAGAYDVGLDLAKNEFEGHGAAASGRAVTSKGS